MKIQAFLLDSASGQVCKIDAPLLMASRQEVSEYHQVVKSISDQKGSRRLREKYGTQIDGVKCASRPFDLALYAYATTLNTYHARAVRAKAKDIVGRPWKIAGDGPQAAKDRITDFFRHAFGRKTFAEGMGCVWSDYEALGNGYLEVIPNQKGEPAELAHVPATEVWIRLDELGFVQQKNAEYAHFRAYGVEDDRYPKEGDNDPLAANKAFTSLIHFSRYSPWSPYYGIPSVMPAWNALTLMTLVAEFNLQFFSNNAIPDYAVILEGESAEGAVDTIKEYFTKHLKGQAHKTMVLETPGGGKVRFEKLTSDAAREASFRLLRQDCRDELMHAHGVPPQKVGIVETGKLGGNLATEQIEEYKNSIVTPGQEQVVTRLNEIIERGFKITNLRFEFEPYDTEDRKKNADVDAAYLDRRVLTPNEVRSRRFPDLKPLEGGDEPITAPATSDLLGVDEALKELQRDIRQAVTR